MKNSSSVYFKLYYEIEKCVAQYGTEFWGDDAADNYGFGSSEIEGKIDNHPAMNQTPFPKRMAQMPQAENNNLRWEKPQGSEYQITMPKPQEVTTWNKLKDWAENTGDAMQAGAVGYATGATLGNFDEAMGTATAAVTLNPRNYTMGRDAVRQLQNDLNKRHPYIYGGAEFVGAMTTPMHLVKEETFKNKAFNALTDTINASVGYSENWDDFATNLAVNGAANMAGLIMDKVPLGRAAGRPLIKFGKRIIKQGINSSADKMKNMYYKEGEEEEKYY